MLDGGRPLEPAEPRDADRARSADPAEVVAQDVDDHHVLGPVLGAGQELGRERAVFLGRRAARSRALDRVGRDPATRPDREERLGRSRHDRPRRAGDVRSPAMRAGGARARGTRLSPGRVRARGSPVLVGVLVRARATPPQVQVRREERRIPGPEGAVEWPGVGAERGREAAGQVRLVDVASGDRGPDRLDALLVGDPGQARAEGEGRRPGVRGLRPRRPNMATGEPGPDLGQPLLEPPDVPVEGPTAEPGPAVAPIEGDRPVVEREPQRGQVLVVDGDQGQSLERVPQVVAEEADEPADERRQRRRRGLAGRRVLGRRHGLAGHCTLG